MMRVVANIYLVGTTPPIDNDITQGKNECVR